MEKPHSVCMRRVCTVSISPAPPAGFLDGEPACFTGVADDFDKLWNRTHDHEAKLCAFDLLELNRGRLPAQAAAGTQKKLFKTINRQAGLEYVEHLKGDGAMILEHACKLGMRVSSASAWIIPTGRGHPRVGRRSKTKPIPPYCGSRKPSNWNGNAGLAPPPRNGLTTAEV
jgi:hypothetical protein